MSKTSVPVFTDTKAHYDLLDGLRGVAALLVVFYHVFEGFQFASGSSTVGGINHGYLAVDFFFILSGFVVGYAYDDRLGTTMTLGNFFKRRLIRLHPMVVMGAVIGVAAFCIGGSGRWDGSHAATSAVMLALLCMMLLVPAVPGMERDVRGNGEMFPLNGPSWSLFFEYIGNILYAVFIHRLSRKALGWLVAALGAAYAWFVITNQSGYGNNGVGWTLADNNFLGGLLRMLFPFTVGMFLSRGFRPMKVRGAFWICSLALLALFAVPCLPSGGVGEFSLNGLYEAVCVAAVFPLLVWMGASGSTTDRGSSAVCKFLGDISYPLYMVHYPLMYLFYQWLISRKLYTLGDTWHVALPVCAGSIVLAFLCLKLYDEPLRRFLSRRFLKKKGQRQPSA